MAIRYDGRVAIVTGAGAGLGKQYALFLAARGARVVVNDVAEETAAAVVAEIVRSGGEAIAAVGSVSEGETIVRSAIQRCRSIHIWRISLSSGARKALDSSMVTTGMPRCTPP